MGKEEDFGAVSKNHHFGTNEASILNLVASFVGKNDATDNANQQEDSTKEQITEPDLLSLKLLTNEEKVKVVIFTKDRPWQLEQLFQSMQLHMVTTSCIMLRIQLVIVARVTKEFAPFYASVCARLRESISKTPLQVNLEFMEEHDEQSFEACMMKVVNLDDDMNKTTRCMFLTDDCLLLVSLVELIETAVHALQIQDACCFLSRLHPGISWCQTKNQPSRAPSNSFQYQPCRVYTYPLSKASGEWAYPWDLSGGVYSLAVVRSVLRQLKGTPALSHPNRLEIRGNQALSLPSSALCCIPTRPYLVVLAINRVQKLFQAPLACQEDKQDELDPMALVRNLESGTSLDMARYRNTKFESSHIGHVWYKNKAEKDHRTTINQVALSVLIPVRSGPPAAAAHAVTTILMQPIEEHQHCTTSAAAGLSPIQRLSPLQMVLVDDACVDGSVHAMVAAAQDLVKAHAKNVCLMVVDHCKLIKQAPCQTEKHKSSSVFITIDIYASPRPGISAALNWGLKHCQSDLVARMDADDISAPGRLLAQVEAMRAQPSLSVLGTHSLVFRRQESSTEETIMSPPTTRVPADCSHTTRVPADCLPYSQLLKHSTTTATISVRPCLHPTSAGFTAWSMYFSCCLAHASVMFRKNAVERVGGYDEAYSSAEDYHLWLRFDYCQSVASLPRIGLWHRKHASLTNTTKQTQEALRACKEAMEWLLQSVPCSKDMVLSDEAMVTLRNPGEALTMQDLDKAAELLVSLEQAFLLRHDKTLTKREAALVKQDCDARIGELGTLIATKFGAQATQSSKAWKLWVERSPHCTLERIALLCHGS